MPPAIDPFRFSCGPTVSPLTILPPSSSVAVPDSTKNRLPGFHATPPAHPRHDALAGSCRWHSLPTDEQQSDGDPLELRVPVLRARREETASDRTLFILINERNTDVYKS